MTIDAPVAAGLTSLSVFLPCYNEQDNVRRVSLQCVSTLTRLVSDWELIIVNDGSADDTGAIAEELSRSNPRIHVVHHEVNRGYGAALQSGFHAATKEYVFYTDGDGQFDVDQIELLLPLAGRFDIVSGYRVHRQDSTLRRFNAWAWNQLVRTVLKFHCRDVDSAFKLYRRSLFDHIEMHASGALIDAEILARANRAGYTLGEVPVRHLPRQAGTSTGGNPRVILRAFKELLGLRRDILATPKARITP